MLKYNWLFNNTTGTKYLHSVTIKGGALGPQPAPQPNPNDLFCQDCQHITWITDCPNGQKSNTYNALTLYYNDNSYYKGSSYISSYTSDTYFAPSSYEPFTLKFCIDLTHIVTPIPEGGGRSCPNAYIKLLFEDGVHEDNPTFEEGSSITIFKTCGPPPEQPDWIGKQTSAPVFQTSIFPKFETVTLQTTYNKDYTANIIWGTMFCNKGVTGVQYTLKQLEGGEEVSLKQISDNRYGSSYSNVYEVYKQTDTTKCHGVIGSVKSAPALNLTLKTAGVYGTNSYYTATISSDLDLCANVWARPQSVDEPCDNNGPSYAELEFSTPVEYAGKDKFYLTVSMLFSKGFNQIKYTFSTDAAGKEGVKVYDVYKKINTVSKRVAATTGSASFDTLDNILVTFKSKKFRIVVGYDKISAPTIFPGPETAGSNHNCSQSLTPDKNPYIKVGILPFDNIKPG